jgi:hypothetical protein
VEFVDIELQRGRRFGRLAVSFNSECRPDYGVVLEQRDIQLDLGDEERGGGVIFQINDGIRRCVHHVVSSTTRIASQNVPPTAQFSAIGPSR